VSIKTVLQIDQMIKNQSTGSPFVLAEKLGISERAVYKYLKFMKEELTCTIHEFNVATRHRTRQL
jgi:biotin operon repressor